jgi:hypothetical protein
MQDKGLERRLTGPISSLFWIYLCWQGNVGNISSDRKSKYAGRIWVVPPCNTEKWGVKTSILIQVDCVWWTAEITLKRRKVFLFVFKCWTFRVLWKAQTLWWEFKESVSQTSVLWDVLCTQRDLPAEQDGTWALSPRSPLIEPALTLRDVWK